MNQITVPSSLIAPTADMRLTPAMTATLWQIAAVLDEKRIVAGEDAIWLTIPTKRLRGPGGRDDNHWLSQCLTKLSHVHVSGEVKGEPWGAVLIAEWRFESNGSIARLLIPPSALRALRSSDTFAKIETEAAYRLSGHARRLYALLADRKRQARPSWRYSLDELRSLLGVAELPSYAVWQAFKRWILAPSIEQINQFGTVEVQMYPVKEGRTVTAVRFEWRWKTPGEAIDVLEENKRHSRASRRTQKATNAPPMIEKPSPDPALSPAPEAREQKLAMDWWERLTEEDHERWSDTVGREITPGFKRRVRDIALDAYRKQVEQEG